MFWKPVVGGVSRSPAGKQLVIGAHGTPASLSGSDETLDLRVGAGLVLPPGLCGRDCRFAGAGGADGACASPHDSGPPPKRRGSSALQAGALRREHQRPREKKRHPGEATRTWREAPGGTPSPILTPGLWRRQTSAVRAAEAGTPSRPARHPTAHPRERAGDSRSPTERRRRSRTVPGLAFTLSSGGRFRDTRFPVAPSVLFAEAPAHAFCYFH